MTEKLSTVRGQGDCVSDSRQPGIVPWLVDPEAIACIPIEHDQRSDYVPDALSILARQIVEDFRTRPLDGAPYA